MRACHTCDNTICCNPSHLFAGTAKDNTQDAIAKGRFRLPQRHKETTAARVALAKLNADPAFLKAQGERIRAGQLAAKDCNQRNVRQFAFGF